MLSKEDIISAMSNLTIQNNPKYEGTAFLFKSTRTVILNGNTF